MPSTSWSSTARTRLPLNDRKKRLARLLSGRRLGIVLSGHTDDNGATIFRQACVMGLYQPAKSLTLGIPKSAAP
jgi:hypothetical protein